MKFCVCSLYMNSWKVQIINIFLEADFGEYPDISTQLWDFNAAKLSQPFWGGKDCRTVKCKGKAALSELSLIILKLKLISFKTRIFIDHNAWVHIHNCGMFINPDICGFHESTRMSLQKQLFIILVCVPFVFNVFPLFGNVCTFSVFSGINHNVDELLVGILTQLRLKRQKAAQEKTTTNKVTIYFLWH